MKKRDQKLARAIKATRLKINRHRAPSTKLESLLLYNVDLQRWKGDGVTPGRIAQELTRSGYPISEQTVRRAYALIASGAGIAPGPSKSKILHFPHENASGATSVLEPSDKAANIDDDCIPF